MRQVREWMAVVVLCCAVGAVAEEAKPDARLQEAQTAFAEAKKLRDAGQYAKAIKQVEHALALREAVLGGMHPEVATSLSLLGELHQRQQNFDQAEPFFRRSLSIREAAFGKDHPDVADSLHSLAILYKNQGMYAQAEPLYQRALAIMEVALGKNHPDVARVLNNLANLYVAKGAYDQAGPLFERALAIRETALGKDHPGVATTLNALAALYHNQGLFSRAKPLYERALAIREAALSGKHPAVAETLKNLANLDVDQGLYGQAELLLQRALAIEEAALGKEHLSVGNTLINLAVVYQTLGALGRAEPLYERTRAIYEAALGKNHPRVAQVLNNLGSLYVAQGLNAPAESLYLRALSIYEAALGKVHPEIARTLTNLAVLYMNQNLPGRARPLYERALAIEEAVVGKNHPDVAIPLNKLAVVYAGQGMHARAEALCQRALAIQEKALGKDHPDIAISLENLGSLYRDKGLYDRASPFLERALALREAGLGKNHPIVALSLDNLSLLRLAQHRLAEAGALLTRSLAISELRLRQEALDFSESRLTGFLELLRPGEERLYALLRAHPDNDSVRRLALNAVLLLKGRSIEEVASTSRTVYRSLGTQDRDTFEQLRGLRTQLAKLSLEGPGALTPADYQQRLKELAEQGNTLEADLARRSAPLRALTALPPPEEIAGRVAAALPHDGALIEFIAYEDHPLVSKPRTLEAKRPGQLRYLALVLFPDGHTGAVDLGPAAPIDKAASSLRNALANRDASFQAPAQALYQLAFRPLLPLLGNSHHLFLSPDGQLALIPFAALHDGRQFLIDSFDFTYLTSGKDLLPRPQGEVSSHSVVVLADPDFSSSTQVSPAASGSTPGLAERAFSLERFFSTLRADMAERPWVPLPGTRQEAEAIQRLIPQAQLFLGSEASKERLLQLPAPGVLHLATHGFFLEDAPAPEGSRAVGHFGALGAEFLAPRSPDPLLRSGLVLAGGRAPAPHSAGAAKPRPDSALVTALELAGLNLWGTQLVVLSACDTGRGDVKLGQGVYGLRRAFVTAGVETVAMSLWKVNDEATRQLMEAYYRNLLAGQGRATALRAAMRTLRLTQPHPHYWAPFIALGRDAPLRVLSSNVQEPPAKLPP